jgi:hypothetical protein
VGVLALRVFGFWVLGFWVFDEPIFEGHHGCFGFEGLVDWRSNVGSST